MQWVHVHEVTHLSLYITIIEHQILHCSQQTCKRSICLADKHKMYVATRKCLQLEKKWSTSTLQTFDDFENRCQQTNCETGSNSIKLIANALKVLNFYFIFFVTSADHRYLETEIKFKDTEIHQLVIKHICHICIA